jgi:hypothetical protein
MLLPAEPIVTPFQLSTPPALACGGILAPVSSLRLLFGRACQLHAFYFSLNINDKLHSRICDVQFVPKNLDRISWQELSSDVAVRSLHFRKVRICGRRGQIEANLDFSVHQAAR